jgi:hypothetical protein
MCYGDAPNESSLRKKKKEEKKKKKKRKNKFDQNQFPVSWPSQEQAHACEHHEPRGFKHKLISQTKEKEKRKKKKKKTSHTLAALFFETRFTKSVVNVDRPSKFELLKVVPRGGSEKLD